MEKYVQNTLLVQEETKKETSISLDKAIRNAKTRAGKLKRKCAYPGPKGKYLIK